MRIGKKIFPYPLLNNIKILSNYLDKEFNIIYSFNVTPAEIRLIDLKFETNSELINRLYDEQKIEVVCIVECSDTVFRKKYKVGKNGFDLALYKADLSEKTNISFFAYATQDFVMKSDEFEEDYQNINFKIDKYDIIAANDDKYINVEHHERENDLARSIFSVSNDHSKNDGRYSVDYSSNKIAIFLSDEDYANYKVISNINEYKEIFFNMLLIPVLIDALISCQLKAKNGATIEEIGDEHHWFRSIVTSYKKLHNEELTVETFINKKIIEMSQELLGSPLNTSFRKMIQDKAIPKGDE